MELILSPPNTCDVKYNRDCPPKGGCVVSAIKSHTEILNQCIQQGEYDMDCSRALKYVVHFLGDITQPLHCSKNGRGGNEVYIKFDSLRRSLHHVPPTVDRLTKIWDSDIPEKLVKQLDPPNFRTWTSSLEQRINSDPSSFLNPPTDWIRCIDPNTSEKCAIEWAEESNAFTCSFVYLNYEDQDLGGDYFDGAVPIVETQVAKGMLLLDVLADD